MPMFLHQTALIADDQSHFRQQLADAVHAADYLVTAQAGNTDDLLEKFRQQQPDLVILDVTSPGTFDPLVAIDRMRRQNPSATILVTGASSQNAVIMEAMSMGAVDFLLKPFQRGSIRSCLQRNA